MDSKLLIHLLVAITLTAAVTSGWSQEPPPPAPDAVDRPEPRERPPLRDFENPERPKPRWPEEFRERLEKMSEKERDRFLDNLQRWNAMGENEKKKLKEAGRDDWSRMREEVDQTIRDLGLQLDRDQREMFELRFRQERRKVEQKVRAELDAIRQPLLKEMREVLRTEFQGNARPLPTPAPAPSPTAGN